MAYWVLLAVCCSVVNVIKKSELLALWQWFVCSLLGTEQIAYGFSIVYTQQAFYRNDNAVLAVRGKSINRLIYHRHMLECNSALAIRLQHLAKGYGCLLQQDRREGTVYFKGKNRRRHHLIMCTAVFFSTLISTKILAEEITQTSLYLASTTNNATVVKRLDLFFPASNFFSTQLSPPAFKLEWSSISEQLSTVDSNHFIQPHANSHKVEFLFTDENYRHVLKILEKKWVKRSSDPLTLTGDIAQLARYIASQPEAYQLITSLAKQPLYLHYKKSAFHSVVKGSQFSVRSVRIYFDPRSAAQLKSNHHCSDNLAHCVASPADAFLHEVLHSKIALLDTAKFIRSGAMSTVLYPRAHEREVIGLERKMYLAMSMHDGQPRPMRNTHQGQLLAANCVTCLGRFDG